MTGLLLIAGAWLLLTVALPIVAALRASRALRQAELLRHELARLGDEVSRLRAQVATPPAAPPEDVQPAWATAPPVPPPLTSVQPPVGPFALPAEPPDPGAPSASSSADFATDGSDEEGPRSAPAPAPPPPAPPPSRGHPLSLEDRIGSRWLLYVGLVAIVLGTSYFIKYAFENNWVTPAMRVSLGGLAGAGLVEAGRRFSRRGLAFYGQMLAAGGVVLLYVAVYAALNSYALISPAVAFALMGAVTGLAAGLAHAEGSQGMAVLAAMGGYLTPFLVSHTGTQSLLFTYDAILVLGTLWLARRHEWPSLHLVSLFLVVLTIASWFDTHYVPALWLRTEGWLTLFALLFLFVRLSLKATPAGDRRADLRLARLVLGLTPLLYHVVSLGILWRHSGGLLVYLIAASLVGIITAGHLRRPSLRVLTWVAVAVPALAWLSVRPVRWDPAPLVVLFAIYALHAAAQARELAGRREGPPLLEVLLLHGNGLWLWGGLALLLDRFAAARLGAMTFALSAWYGMLTAAVFRSNRETSLHLLALAGAFLGAGVAFEYDGAALTVAWAAEAAAIIGIGLVVGRTWLRVGGGALLVVAVWRIVQELSQPASAAAVVLINARSLTALFVVALLLLIAWGYRARGAGLALGPEVKAALIVTASSLLLAWATSEVNLWFARAAWAGHDAAGAGAVTAADLARQVTLSTLWASYALALVAIGIRRRYRPLRLLAIAIFALTVGKVFLVDLSRLDRFFRILSTVALGVLLLGASYLYQRFTRLHALGESPAESSGR